MESTQAAVLGADLKGRSRFQLTRSVLTDAEMMVTSPGMMHPPSHSGVDVDRKLAASFAYNCAFLPVDRLEGGTIFNG